MRYDRDSSSLSWRCPLGRARTCFYRTISNPSLYSFWGRDITKANFFFLFVICGWGQGTGKFVLPLRSIKSSDGTGGQAGTFRWTSPMGTPCNTLVIRSSAVTYLAQCRSEQLVSIASPSRNSLNDSQEENDVSISRGCYRMCVLNDCAVLDWLCFSIACIAQAQECVKLRCTHAVPTPCCRLCNLARCSSASTVLCPGAVTRSSYLLNNRCFARSVAALDTALCKPVTCS